MEILVTFDENYRLPFKVMVSSLVNNNPEVKEMTIYLVHRSISTATLKELTAYCEFLGITLIDIKVDSTLFKDAPITKRYPQEMYYRLLAPNLLPKHVEKILYLDPDILIINSLRKLWELDLREATFAAAAHTGMTEIANNFNRLRLGTKHDYYNSGIILMDLVKARELIKAEDIFNYVSDNSKALVLPDQDVFNALYGKETLAIPDELWNYDVRNYSNYLLRSKGEDTLGWVIQHTSILHFCGSNKPWQTFYTNSFGALYKHYMAITSRNEEQVALLSI
ncbi:glycosyltransferase family 8 protein [Vagococcus zengguangii]|uniref:Glycosyltransferase family 8 protein n=1 Tax=Vagococcus zengguangii TaxID=2571750 RepID=A0A4D7CRY7_9ENTE|nr:glycosyltransferase family 8 protein [Vagococcus zengguangii]QCI86965.1 glycosyltransferase family 8 protein [Vagococcus zengguangii]TLG80992.1 glycosyltransferase family 8 protein [Vagococcus zengguangii]